MSEEERKRHEENAATWGRAAATYGEVGPQFFSHFGRRLVELADIPSGAKVLDVATGRGALLFPAAEKIGPQGEVTGIDYSEGMVQRTAQEIAARGVTNARVLQMDAENLHFDDGTFDCVLCGFALFFFPHLDRALSEFRRVLKPGGLLAVSTWTKWDERWKWLDELRTSRRRPQQDQDGPEFHTEAGMQAVMRHAGFTGISVIEEGEEYFYKDGEEWLQTMWSHGGRFELEGLAPQELEQRKRVVFNKTQAMKQQEGIPQRYTALFTLSHKPDGE